MATPSPIDVARPEDVTEEHLGGASLYELVAFQMAVYEYGQAAEVDPWTAIAVMWDEGNWREIVAERSWSKWQLALRRTAEEQQRGV